MGNRVLAILAGVLVLAGANWTILQREQHLTGGEIALLELAPVDPRSLMQGDYMALDFAIAQEAFGPTPPATDGHLVVRLDEQRVAHFERFDHGEPLAADERRLRFRVRDGRVRFATNAYFFEEGTAARYTAARYGEFRLIPDGTMLLTHLRGADFERLDGS